MHSGSRTLSLALVAALGLPLPLPARQKPSRRPPIEVDHDQNDIPEPKRRQLSLYYDFLDNSLVQQVKQVFDFRRAFRARPAENVNSRDEVPDSSWFTNRNGRRRMSPEEIRRGPSLAGGPVAGPWTIVSSKALGASPGFVIADAAGRRFLIKFDSTEFPELATGAEVVATKLYYASGYNTPETYLAQFRPEDLRIAEDVTILDRRGRKRLMTPADVDEILSGVARLPGGRIRVMASRFLSGKVKGQFQFYGRRRDDPNDWIPHEHRRDLRGLRVIASWLNDDDVYALNTLDVHVNESGRRFLRHYILDFSSALGADNRGPNYDRAGHEYLVDGAQIAKSLLALGFYRRPWDGRVSVAHKSIGAFDNALLDPERWRPNAPVVAFENMTVADGYWGAKIVASFTDEQIRAAVEAGEYSDRAAAEYLARTLIERRDLIAGYWFARAGALDHFRVASEAGGPALAFDDLLVARGFRGHGDRVYRYRIGGEKRGRWQELAADAPWRIALDPLANHSDLVIEVQVRDAAGKEWSPAVAVHLAPERGTFLLLGWVRSEK